MTRAEDAAAEALAVEQRLAGAVQVAVGKFERAADEGDHAGGEAWARATKSLTSALGDVQTPVRRGLLERTGS